MAYMDSRLVVEGTPPNRPSIIRPGAVGNGAMTPHVQWRGQPRAKDPFTCAYCGARAYLKAFPTVYGNGSMMARSRRGLMLKTGWSETFRQSILAQKCSPPKPRKAFWRVCIMLLGVSALGITSKYRLKPEISECAAIVVVAGLFLVADAIRWNRVKYPLRMEKWENSFLCGRCNKVTIIEPINQQ
jgi:hypothetical protein